MESQSREVILQEKDCLRPPATEQAPCASHGCSSGIPVAASVQAAMGCSKTALVKGKVVRQNNLGYALDT